MHKMNKLSDYELPAKMDFDTKGSNEDLIGTLWESESKKRICMIVGLNSGLNNHPIVLQSTATKQYSYTSPYSCETWLEGGTTWTLIK